MTRKLLLALLLTVTAGFVIAGCGGDGKTGNGGGNKASDDGGEDYSRPEPPAEILEIEKPEFTDEMVAEGKKIYTTHCQTCHGPEGKGDGPAGKALNPQAQDLTNPDLQAAISDHYMFWRITEGGAALGYTGMTPFEEVLKPEERWEVIAYLRTLAD